MNVTNLKENYQNLLSFMAEKGYKESTINGYRHQIQWILDLEENRKWTSYKDIYLEYASYGYSYNWLRGKRPFLVLWRGLICTVNIRMENIIIRFLQEMHMTFFSRISKGSLIFIRMPSQNPIYAHRHLITGPVLRPDFSIICKIMVVVPWLMLQKKWYSRFLPRTATVHGVMTTYKGFGQY